MSEIRDEPAFPHIDSGCGRFAEGMSMRDYFAAKAIQGMLASGNFPKSASNYEAASVAYGMADAMLIVRAENE